MITELLLTEEIGNKMDLQKFIEKRPYLYHLTNSENATKIITKRKLFSANRLIDMSANPENQGIKSKRRLEHTELFIEEERLWLRDQRPISELVLSKCLTNGWSVQQFLEYLNDRVFMWPTLDRLSRHYDRYANEGPSILRFRTKEVLDLNPHVKFCRLNSGATRANSHLGGIAPERGPNTFMDAIAYPFPIGSVAEVTFEGECSIDCEIWVGTSPQDKFELVKF